ncbi:hypothetical protein [Paraburkholderia antibiotica]|nr:hypothetical protein [Paraburkholderia antibiotica]
MSIVSFVGNLQALGMALRTAEVDGKKSEASGKLANAAGTKRW